MKHKSPVQDIQVALTTPLTARALTATLPATMTLGECIDHISGQSVENEPEREIIHQIRREIAGSRFDILVFAEGESPRRADPSTPLAGCVHVVESSPTEGVARLPTAILEVQAYSPVA